MGFNAADFMPDSSDSECTTWRQGHDIAPAGDPEERRVTASLRSSAAKAVLAHDVPQVRQKGPVRHQLEAAVARKVEEDRRWFEEAARRHTAREKAAVERERQMFEEIRRMRRLAEAGEKRERFMVKLTLAGVAFGGLGGLGGAAAVAALLVG